MRTAHNGIRLLLVIGVASLATGCAATRQVDGSSGRSDVLTREEIQSAQGVQNLHDVVQKLRPRWLTARAPNRSLSGATATIAVYQDQAMLGEVDVLRQFGPAVAYELRFLDGPTATASLPGLGSGHWAGAIVIITRPPNN